MREIKIAFAIIIVIFFTVMLYEVWPFLHALGMGIYYVAWFTLGIICLALLAWVGRLLIPLFEKTVDKTIDLQAQRAAIEREQAELRLKFHLTRYAMSTQAHIEIDGVKVTHVLPPQTRVIEEAQQPKMLPAPQEHLELPGKCDFADILDIWRPSPEQILLALGPGGERVTVPIKALCHVALAGATGGGKSVIMRLLLSQLLFVGAKVILADPHYAPVDLESGEDWRPIASRLMMEPAVQYGAIKDVLMWLATQELPNRLERRRIMQPVGEPLFLAMDELPAIAHNIPEAPEYMATLLREGRKVGLYLVSAAQDWLVKTVGGTGGVRDCFRTAFYVGGDATTARVLLDVRGTVDDGGLGKGIVMLRSMATPKASLTRIPYASNDALMELLPVPSTATTTANITAFPTARTRTLAVDEGALAVDAVKDTDPLQATKLDARAVRVRELVKAQTLPSKIIEEVWGVSAKQGGTAYAKAARELSAIMAELI